MGIRYHYSTLLCGAKAAVHLVGVSAGLPHSASAVHELAVLSIFLHGETPAVYGGPEAANTSPAHASLLRQIFT